MSAARALKRRRLDDTRDTTKSSPVPVAKRQNDKLPQPTPATSNGTAAVRNLWQEAKAKAQAAAQSKRLASRREVNVYDDIEGANAGQRRASASGAARKLAQKKQDGDSVNDADGRRSLDQKREEEHETVNRSTKVSSQSISGGTQKIVSPMKKNLDPLKNQKEQAFVSPKKSSSSLGFFKQFHKPPPPKEPEMNGIDGITQEVSGKGRTDVAEGQPEDAAKNWFYGKPKKTFEDEIRELEESARKKAADDESEDELASQDSMRRSSTRKPSKRKPFEQKANTQPAAASPLAKVSKPLDRRKSPLPKALSTKELVDVISDSQNTQMEIDDSEEEQLSLTPKRPSFIRGERTSTSEKTEPHKAKVDLKPPTNVKLEALEPEQLQCIRRIVLEKTVRKRPLPLTNLDDEYVKVHTVINQTITAGESNSILLIGARGSGKSSLIDQILREENEKHPHDFHAVRLNGFVHTDDKIALREIWRQLGKEMDLGEEEGTSKNYADTMSKLLALLSHPGEMDAEEPDRLTKSVIFILDEFELFATHPRQTLLYNLFDIAQSRKAPIAVLGLTSRIDVAESLEKRVKSRFSHRYVHLSLPKSFQAFEQVCAAALTITRKELTSSEMSILAKTTKVQKLISDEPEALSLWNAFVEYLLRSDSCNTFLRRLYYTTKSVPDFLGSSTIALATMPVESKTTAQILTEHFATALLHSHMQPPDSKLSLLSSLSTVQLALLVCAARLTNIYGTEAITFPLVYEEYRSLAAKAKLQASAAGAVAQGAGNRVCGKGVAHGAWGDLIECGLIMEDGRSGGTARVDVGLEEIGMSGVELGHWGRWCKEI